MNVIAIVTHSRPECLQIHLEQLLKNPELPEYLVHFFVDYGAHPEIFQVIKEFRRSHKDIKVTSRTQTDASKSPLPAFYNIFSAYEIAAKETDEYVLPTEEDIVPTEDYLRYHRVVYDKFLSKYDRIFCVSTKRRQLPDIGDPKYLIGDRQLCQPTCISKESIEKYIIPRIEERDWWMPIDYNRRVWPGLRNEPTHHIHHDGQLERIAETNDLFCLKPDHARSGHIGVAGQHFNGKVQGKTRAEKIAWLKSVMHDTKALEEASDNPYDMIAIPETLEWTTLELDLDRDKVITQKADFDPNNSFKEYIINE